jgi:nucleotide-binding universal stress UspA family protein
MKLILVALDASPRAAALLKAAAALAGKTGARLRVLRVVSLPVDLPVEALRIAPDALPGMLLGAAEQDLAARTRELEPGLVDGVRARLGVPWQAICDEARECQADLIVIGSHGHTALDRLLGTTAAKVVNHADRSVLVVRGTV